MNRNFRLVWSRLLGAYVPAAEHVASRSKSGGGRAARLSSVVLAIAGTAAALSPVDMTFAQIAPPAATALPTRGQVMAGQASIANGIAGESFSITGNGDSSNLVSRNVGAGLSMNTFTGLQLGVASSNQA